MQELLKRLIHIVKKPKELVLPKEGVKIANTPPKKSESKVSGEKRKADSESTSMPLSKEQRVGVASVYKLTCQMALVVCFIW
jgi:hypothetical protein